MHAASAQLGFSGQPLPGCCCFLCSCPTTHGGVKAPQLYWHHPTHCPEQGAASACSIRTLTVLGTGETNWQILIPLCASLSPTLQHQPTESFCFTLFTIVFRHFSLVSSVLLHVASVKDHHTCILCPDLWVHELLCSYPSKLSRSCCLEACPLTTFPVFTYSQNEWLGNPQCLQSYSSPTPHKHIIPSSAMASLPEIATTWELSRTQADNL